MEKNFLLSTAYLPPIDFFISIGGSNLSVLNDSELYKKQTFRNRTHICAANGLQSLIIPIQRPYNIPIREVKIEYNTPWQRNHWRSITTAYNRSPYFEFYQDLFIPFYTKKIDYLFDYNYEIIQLSLKLLKLSKLIPLLSEVEKSETNLTYSDLHFDPKGDTLYDSASYSQVFSNKFGFLKNVSIIDLLFNLGPLSASYIIQNVNGYE